jgi:hypothetical protein
VRLSLLTAQSCRRPVSGVGRATELIDQQKRLQSDDVANHSSPFVQMDFGRLLIFADARPRNPRKEIHNELITERQ